MNFLGCVAACLLVALAAGAQGLDFSGSWVLDQERSFSNPQGLDQSMTIVQNAEEIRLDAKLKTTRDGERAVQETWILDGVERDFEPPSPPGAKGKRKAYQLPENRGIAVEEVITIPGTNGPATQQVVRKWTLSADGSTLTVDYYIDTPRGSGESKRVFRRK